MNFRSSCFGVKIVELFLALNRPRIGISKPVHAGKMLDQAISARGHEFARRLNVSLFG